MTFKERAEQLVAQMTFAEKMEQMKYDAPAIPRLGVPAYNWWNECLHGVARSGAATVYPQAIAMAATFDTGLMYQTACEISDEARAKYNEYKQFGDTLIYQGLTYWSPNINIFRDPRWGRGHETYGEDPYLTGHMAEAFINGLQGNGTYRKLDATIKHFIVHSGPEQGRHSFNSVVSDKDLRETYLPAFKYCIEHADPSAVMGAYNRINGEPACASETYLKKLLYGELKFDGYVVSDCGAICDINDGHHVTNNAAESAALAVNNGCSLNCGSAYQWLKTAASLNLITEETVTEAVVRLFTARFRLGMFDNDCEYDNIPISVVDCPKHRETNLHMAEESIVLLKNNGILPLKKGLKIAVIGPNADDKSVLMANYNGTPSHYTTILRGIQDAAEPAESTVRYARGCHPYIDEVHQWAEHPAREAVLAARDSDVVVLCMGLTPAIEGEEGDAYNGDISGDKKDIELPVSQQKLYAQIMETGKPVIFVNISGSCVNLSEQDAQCAAVVQCFYPGAEGGTALARILFGKVSPSGRLPVTFYRSADDLPPFTDYSMQNRTYRFFKGPVVYPFGYGLTYSTITEKWTDTKTCVLSNTGSVDTGYVLLRYDETGSLCSFKRVFINAGETITVSTD